jgi:hypothetical protein
MACAQLADGVDLVDLVDLVEAAEGRGAGFFPESLLEIC